MSQSPESKTAAIAAFFEQFDNYVEARDRLKHAPEGSKDEQLIIADCADKWPRLVVARARIAA